MTVPLNGLLPHIMQEIFETKSNYYSTRNAPAFSSRNIKTVRYALQTISLDGTKNFEPFTQRDETSQVIL